MNSEVVEVNASKNEPIKLTGSIKQVTELKAKINIPVMQVPPATEELEITPTEQEQVFIPPENTYYNKVTCDAVNIQSSSLTIIPSSSEQTFTPPTGEYYNSVTCNAIPSEYVIPTGELSITSNGIYDVKNYASANVEVPGGSINVDWTEIGYEGQPQSIEQSVIDGYNYAKQIKDTWTNSVIDGYARYYGDFNLIFFPSVNNSNMTRMACIFQNCYSLLKVGYMQTEKMDSIGTAFRDCFQLREVFDIDSKITSGTFSMDNLFYRCVNLENAPNISSTRRTNAQNAFYGCTKLKHVPQFNLGTQSGQGVSSMQNMFTNCSSLTDESLNNIMGTIKNLSYYAGQRTLAYIGLSSTQATKCTTLPNWEAIQNAGWTTGY